MADDKGKLANKDHVKHKLYEQLKGLDDSGDGSGTCSEAALTSMLVFVGAADELAKKIIQGARRHGAGGKIDIEHFCEQLFVPPCHATPGTPLFAATLNFLGNAYNPMEFMTSDPDFIKRYDAVRGEFKKLTVDLVISEAKELGFEESAVQETFRKHKIDLESNPCFEQACSSEFLKQDNKVEPLVRTNMVVHGMIPASKGPPLFREVVDWRLLMTSQVDQYQKHLELALWDIACNLAAEKSKDAYEDICNGSYLNPENTLKNVQLLLNELVKAVRGGHEVVCAVQEFPEKDTPKNFALLCELPSNGLRHVRPEDQNSSVGFIVSSSIEVEHETPSPLGTTAEEVYKKMGETGELNDKDRASLDTTAKKTFVIDVKESKQSGRTQKMRFVSVHAKEFKSESATELLARYTKALAGDLGKKDPPIAVIMLDSNTSSKKMSESYAAALTKAGFHVLSPTDQGYTTTRKKRSEMHGQIYDTKKCMQVVEAHKTFVAMIKGTTGVCKEEGWAVAHPNLPADKDTMLPNSQWPTDHCMLQVKLQMT